MVAVLLAACARQAPAQVERLPEMSQIEPLPATESQLMGGDLAGPEQGYFDYDTWMATSAGPTAYKPDWDWQILPNGIIYQAYLANSKESRMGTQIVNIEGDGAVWDSTLGGRFGLLRYGTCDGFWPQGWQFDVEGSAQVRLDPEVSMDVRSVDFRIGAPLTYGYGRHRLKIGYYHLCSHLVDEFLLANVGFPRLNFVRDTVLLGYSFYATDNLRLYAEGGWAFYTDVSEPLEFQFGLDWAPAKPTGLRGAPFLALNTYLREELDFSGNFTAQAGWAWRGDRTSHLLRVGVHYLNGASNQYSFCRNIEQQIGAGLWYDY
jgi:hypothetical protein